MPLVARSEPTRIERAPTRRDLLGEWFSALEANGEFCSFRLGRYGATMREPEWFFLPHARYDGLGGLAYVLRSVFASEIDLPSSTERPPSSLERILAALRFLFRTRSRPMRWRDEDTALRPRGSDDLRPSALAWALFSKSETEALRDTARRRGVSLNAWLLWGLTRSCLPRLVPDTGNMQWIVPVNLRGFAKTERDTDNAAWAVDVAFDAAACPETVHAAIAEQLRNKTHWGSWELFELLRYLGPKALNAVARREMHVPKHGSFSNMGSLEPRQANALASSDEWWMAFNPVLRSRPVGAACLTWRGRLALTLQLHPGMSRDQRLARDWLDRWTESALGGERPNSTLTKSRAATVTDSPGGGGVNGT
jgi:hypothetical protein